MGKKNERNRVSQSERKITKLISGSMDEIVASFASMKAGAEYTMKIRESMQRYESIRRENLFAIVMPAGTGKTKLADNYGVIDIDRCVSTSEHEQLFHSRKKIIEESKSWVKHNDEWVGAVNATLDMLDFSRPTVILCHTEEMAYEIGAIPVITILLAEEQWNANIKTRSDLGKQMSIINRKNVIGQNTLQTIMARTNDGVERVFLRVMATYGLPVAAPNKYDKLWNDTYSRDVPDWVLSGDKTKADFSVLLALWARDAVPKECMDYFCRTDVVPASFGFGRTMDDWAQLMAEVRFATNTIRKLPDLSDPAANYPYDSDKEKNRVNLNLKRLLSYSSILSVEGVEEILRRHVGENNLFVTSLICFWAGLGRFQSMNEMIFRLCGVNQKWWVPLTKRIHEIVRVSKFVMNTEIDEAERQTIMYMDQLVGRHLYKADWAKTIAERTGITEPDHLSYDKLTDRWTVDQYKRDFLDALSESFHRTIEKPRVSDVMSFDDFYRLREQWLTKGSTVFNTVPVEYREYMVNIVDEVGDVVSEMRKRHNKKSLFQCYDAIGLTNDNFELFNVTKAVEKLNECGYKDRVLLPGGFLHYIVLSYILFFAEKQQQVGSVRLNAPPDDDIRYTDSKLGDGLFRLMYDWANFNAQHSAFEMAAVTEKIAEVVPIPADAKAFCALICESMYNMKLLDPEGNLHKMDNGLFSGWRDTSYKNIVLNDVYLRVARWVFIRLYDYDPITKIDHGGDDVDAAMLQPEDTFKFLRVMNKMRFDAQASKQMIDTKSEFFRVTIDGTAAYASPTRGLAAFIAGNWESSGVSRVRERVTSILDQTAKLTRRGVDREFMNTLTILAITHWAKIRGEVDWMTLPGEVMHGAEECGGLGVPDPDGCVWLLSKPVEIKESKLEVVPPGNLAAMDYIVTLSRELRQRNISLTRVDSLADKLAASSFEVFVEEDFTEMLKYDGFITGKRPVVEPRWDEGLFRAMLDYGASNKTLAKKLARVERYASIVPYMEQGGKPLTKADLVVLLGEGIPIEAVEFSGDVYYRRLVGEPIAKSITEFCRAAILADARLVTEIDEYFRTLCYMSSIVYDHRI